MISAGHPWSEIQHYTIPQFKLFLGYALELEQEQRGVDLVDNAIAAQGSSKSIQQMVDKLLN
ncbi:MAG: hypothetical protein AAGE96_05310 [Cyanobacteria bacterium P01_G01_bin.19]